jgi:hypothetical protein
MVKIKYFFRFCLIAASLFFAFPEFGYAQTRFVNEFLNIGVGARAHGMFGSVVGSVSDGTAAYWNPAGLTAIDAPLQVNAMHANWFGGIANYDFVNLSTRLNTKKKSYAAISMIRMGIDNIPNTLNLVGPDGSIDYNRVTEFSAADYAFLLSYAQAIDEAGNFSIGGNVKVIHRVIGKFATAWGFGTDLSAIWKKDRFSFGVVARDVTTTFNSWSFNLTEEEKDVFERTGNDIPVSSTEITIPRVILAASYNNKIKDFGYLAELNFNISTNGTEAGVFSGRGYAFDPSLGLEFSYIEKVYLRLGFGNIQRVLNEVNANRGDFEIQPNMGIGLKLGRLKVDYALANIGNIAGILSSHIFSVSMDFRPKE